jgi:ATP-dependent helicase/nuclease subunit A
MDEEYKRLLYVALTRAEDQLYICGYKGKTNPIDESWYNYINKAFMNIDNVIIKDSEDIGEIKYFSNKQLRPVKIDNKIKSLNVYNIEIPKWLNQNIAEDSILYSKTLYPSILQSDEPAVLPPLDKTDKYRFKRGTLTHKLLEILPFLDIEKREEAATNFISQPHHDLPAKLQKEIVEEVINIINNPTYSELFGPNSLAEVPICGTINNTVISGKIDRLLVTDKEVWIVDYKTNRPPPKDPYLVSETYISQMRSYQSVLESIYNEKTIKSFLFWTVISKL